MIEMTIEDRALMRRLALGILTETSGRRQLDEMACGLLYLTGGIRRITTSLDDVRAVTDNLLPDWERVSGRASRGFFAYVNNGELHFSGIGTRPNPNRRWYEQVAATEPLACTAVLLLAIADLGGAKRETSPKERMFLATRDSNDGCEVPRKTYVATTNVEGARSRFDAGKPPILVRSLSDIPIEDHNLLFENDVGGGQTVAEWFRERGL